jgi:biotin transport system substrate-specific component
MVRENALEREQGKSKEIVLFGLFTALIAIGAFIRIPVPVCPFTLQLLFTTLAGLILGSRRGALSVTLP